MGIKEIAKRVITDPATKRITKEELEKKLISIELLISSIDSPDRRQGLKDMLISIAERL